MINLANLEFLMRSLGVTRQQLHNVLSGKSVISPEMALRLERAIGSSAEHWLRLQSAYDLAQARKAAGHIDIKRYVARHRPREPQSA